MALSSLLFWGSSVLAAQTAAAAGACVQSEFPQDLKDQTTVMMVLSPRMPYAIKEWQRMKKVAEDAGYKVVGLRDPRVPFTEWVEAVQAADDAELIRMPAINEDQAAALGALNHMPASLVVRSALGGCRTWSADSENGPQRGQFSRDLQAHSQAMGQKDGEKWTAAAHLQPAISKSDSLLLHPWPILGVMPDSAWLLVLRAREAQLEPVTCR